MAQVYIGTYAKYNNGSIAGKWIDLSKCDNYEAFVNACREAHKDEKDPEFMIQDHSDMPDGLACGEWLSREEFNDIKEAEAEENAPLSGCEIIDYSEKAIAVVGDTRKFAESFKAIGGRFNARLSCGAGWIFSKTRTEAVSAVLGSLEAKPAKVAKAAPAAYQNAIDAYLEGFKSEESKTQERKNLVAVLAINGGFLCIGKPSIENKFCFADEGPEYEFYKSLNNENNLRKYFLSENLSDLDNKIKALKDENRPIWVTAPECRYKNVYLRLRWGGYFEQEEQSAAHELTKAERREILAAYTEARESFNKRLQSYLKKYGTSKLHIWSYWRDA